MTKQGTWLQRLFAGSLIDVLQQDRERLAGVMEELSNSVYNANARISTLEGDVNSLSQANLRASDKIAELNEALAHRVNSYEMIKRAHTVLQADLKELAEDHRKLQKINKELIRNNEQQGDTIEILKGAMLKTQREATEAKEVAKPKRIRKKTTE